MIALLLAACTSAPVPAVAHPAATVQTADVRASVPELRLFDLVNQERAAAGALPVVWNDHLAAAAREHAREMVTDEVGHAHGVHVPAAVLVENDARGDTVDAAHAAWMANDRQRANILSTSLEQVGIGVVEANGVVFASEVFVHVGPTIDPGLVAKQLSDALSVTRDRTIDLELAAIAKEFAEGLASGTPEDEVWSAMRSQIAAVERRYVKLRYTVTAVADVAALDPPQLLAGFPADTIGVGVGQGTHPQLGDGAIWVVVVIGERLRQ